MEDKNNKAVAEESLFSGLPSELVESLTPAKIRMIMLKILMKIGNLARIIQYLQIFFFQNFMKRTILIRRRKKIHGVFYFSGNTLT